ncbi:MAG: glutamyl/glutaminyl-tRNA synthetase [Candidatus Peregrinibacteria bacterium Greene0416_19]|nr:MAG: glutamyl/glutaminyl-tRNA synthetase [Candidatus Peregrinibacteria bacterium Greene0416_19]
MRTRFAPSPTGFLHVGGLRTALYSYLLAKQTGGQFLLRIEDTDQERTVEGAVESIVRSLAWAGISPDEGVMMEDGLVIERGSKGPYIQSRRQATGIYREHAEQLLASGHAYRCFCTTERLEEMRRQQEARKQAPMYDRQCLHLPENDVKRLIEAGTSHVIRLKVPHERTIRFDDDIRGTMTFQGHTVDDQVLLKSDGFPTYHLAHVIDDHFMDIDLVLRGEEWLSSLPKHLLLFEYLDWKAPRFAHVPLLLNKDRTKLSKRQNAVSVEEYIAKGYLPEVLLNFLAMLGWNPGTTQETFSLPELVEQFSLDRVQKSGAVFDLEKLDWLQGQWIRKIPVTDFAERIRPIVGKEYPTALHDADFEQKASLIHERITFFHEASAMLGYFYEEPGITTELLANEKQKVKPEELPTILTTLLGILEVIPEKDWTPERLLTDVKGEVAKGTWKLGQLLWPLRSALTGLPYSPGAVEVAAALEREKTLARLKRAREIVSALS